MAIQKGNTDPALLLHVAVRIALAIVGPMPVFILALIPGAIIEVLVESAVGDDGYFQQHRWCQFVVATICGSLIFLARRIPFLESGVWIGPLIIAIGIYILVSG